jgi:SET domain-containing protein
MSSEKLILTTKAEDIAKGQEITISYGLTGEDLTWNYGFMCDCRKCAPDG